MSKLSFKLDGVTYTAELSDYQQLQAFQKAKEVDAFEHFAQLREAIKAQDIEALKKLFPES